MIRPVKCPECQEPDKIMVIETHVFSSLMVGINEVGRYETGGEEKQLEYKDEYFCDSCKEKLDFDSIEAANLQKDTAHIGA